jgi:alpha-L-arabinofuranosidase
MISLVRQISRFCIPLGMLFASGLAAATEIHVSPGGNDANPGTAGAMLKTISAAANLAQPGDTVTVHAGTYRERINPPRGGTSDAARIVYQAASGEAVTIKGSEIVTGWQYVSNDTWTVTLPASFFGDFNPFNNLLTGDYLTANNRNHHTAAVYLNGQWLSAAATQSPVMQAASSTPQWFAAVDGGGYLVNVKEFQLSAGATAGTTVDASFFDRDFSVTNSSSSEGGQCVGHIESGDWTRYANVDFGSGADSIRIRAAAQGSGGRIEVRLDGPTGTVLGTCTATTTGGWQNWQNFTAPITPTSGVHTVCLVYRHPASATASTTIWAQFPGKNPNDELVEINKRQTVFYPEETGINYLTVRGFTLEQAATPWAPPTAEQIGLIGPNWSKGWIIENNTVRYSRCAGISLGKYGDRWDNTATEFEFDGAGAYAQTIDRAVANGWTKATVGSHLVRGNHIHHCEQVGVVGSLGCSFSTVTGNTIHDCWVQKQYSGYEQAGIKLHGAIDVVIRGNHDYDNGGFGIWLDWMAQGTHVTGNLFHGNDQQDLFVEVSHGPFMVDHNIFLSPSSLYLNSQGGCFAHNLFTGGLSAVASDSRLTPYHLAHSTAVVALHDNPKGDMRFYNNIFVQPGQTTFYNSSTLPVSLSGNVYLNGGAASAQESSPLVLAGFNPAPRVVSGFGGYYLQMNADPAWRSATSHPLVATALLGNASIPQLPFEQADGSPYRLDTDIGAAARNEANPFPGPFENVTSGTNSWKVFDDASVSSPTGLTATSGINRAVLSWTPFIGATAYTVKRATTSGGPYTTVASNVTGTSWVDAGVTLGVPYYYVISATDGAAESANSAEASVTPANAIRINCGGGATGNFSADAMYSSGTTYTSGTAVNTGGVANAAPAAVYQSERWGNLTYTVPGLDAGTSYRVRLHFAEIYFDAPGGASGGVGSRVWNVLVNGSVALPNFDAYAAAGGTNKAVVREVNATADANGQITIGLAAIVSNPKISGFEILPQTLPASPAGLTAFGGNAQVSLNWSATAGADAYRVWRATTANGSYTAIGTVASPQFADTNVTNGQTYYYAVSATNVLGESANSAPVSATPAALSSAVWTNPGSGSWPVASNWLNNSAATGSNVVADFSTLNLTNDITVTLDGARTIGGLIFGDTSPSHNWALNAGSGGPLTLDADASPVVRVNNNTATLGVVLAGSKGITKTGAGSLGLTSANSYSGDTTLNAGAIVIGPAGGGTGTYLGTGSLVFNGGTLKTPGTGIANTVISNPIVVNVATTNTLDASGPNINLNGNITGSGTLVKAPGGHAVFFKGDNSGFSGAVNADNIQLGAATAGSAAAAWTSTGGIGLLSNLASSGTIHFGSLSGASGSFVGTHNATGTTTFSIGSLNTDSTFAGVIGNTFAGGSSLTALTKTGGGILTLAGANSYTGATAVNGGTLLVNGGLGNTATSVAATGSLGGTGSIAGSVSNNGTLAPGSNGIGNLTINNTLTLAGGSMIAWEIGNWTGAAGTSWDKLTVSSLNLTASSGSRITIRPAELSLANFTESNASFLLIQTTSGITGFSADKFMIDTSGLTAAQGTWAVQQSGNQLVLVYTAQTNPDANGNGILDTWETAHFGNSNPGANPAGGDADGDGLTNLMEYALNSNPLVPNISTLVHDLESLGDGEHLRLTVPKNSAATNLTYTVETCGALNDWSSLDTTVESSSATQLIVRDNFTTATASRRFIRLRVVAGP